MKSPSPFIKCLYVNFNVFGLCNLFFPSVSVFQDKALQRKQDLEDSLQAHQYFADANEAESWMKEKEPIVGSQDFGKDEDSTEVLIFLNLNFYFTFSKV